MNPQLDAEAARKWLHLAPGGLAVALAWASPWGALLLCLALLAFNLWIFPRLGGARLWRTAERTRGEAPGMVFYPVALLVLAVAARGRLEVLAGGWEYSPSATLPPRLPAAVGAGDDCPGTETRAGLAACPSWSPPGPRRRS